MVSTDLSNTALERASLLARITRYELDRNFTSSLGGTNNVETA